MEILTIITIFTLVAIAWNAAEAQNQKHVQHFMATMGKQNPIYLSGSTIVVKYQWASVGKITYTVWRRCIMVVTAKRIAIYPYPPTDKKVEPLVTIQRHELRGFWRHHKNQIKLNELWIHAQIGLTWGILKLQLDHNNMRAMFQAIKAISTEEHKKAYHRPPPHIHRKPTKAFLAEQLLTGEWQLGDETQLYLMPLYLVIFAGDEVQRTIDLSNIQDIAALKRMEGGDPEGLIRFSYGEEDLAFALNDYEAWAEDLAEAAKRTLEEPVMRKRKSKEEDEWDDEDE